jgi:hypothetical protein
LIAVRVVAASLAAVRVQDGPAPVAVGPGRAIEVRFRLAGGRLRFVRPLLRPGIEVAEGL